MNKEWENMPRKLKEEKITNRVLLNFGYILLGYILLYVFYLYAVGRIFIEVITAYNYVMLGVLCASLLGMIVCYVAGHVKSNKTAKNYGHMLLGISIVVFYLNFSFYTRWISVEALPGFLSTSITFLRNVRTSYIVTAIAMLVYLIIVIAYNSVLLYKKPAASASAGKKSKKKKR